MWIAAMDLITREQRFIYKGIKELPNIPIEYLLAVQSTEEEIRYAYKWNQIKKRKDKFIEVCLRLAQIKLKCQTIEWMETFDPKGFKIRGVTTLLIKEFVEDANYTKI